MLRFFHVCVSSESGLGNGERASSFSNGAGPSLTRTRAASQMLSRPATTATQPSQEKFNNWPEGPLLNTHPPMLEDNPIARSRAQPLKLKNAPRREAGQ